MITLKFKELAEMKDYEIASACSLFKRVYTGLTPDEIISRIYRGANVAGYSFCLAYEFDDVCGVAYYKIDWRTHSGAILFVDTLAAFPSGKGIGRKLLDELSALGAKNSCSLVQLDCRIENADASRFYYDYGMERRASSFIKRL